MLTSNPVTTLKTRSDFKFIVRAASPSDESALGEFFTHVAQDDLRFRFMSGCRTVSHEQLVTMTRSDNQTENFLAFAPDGVLIATAMLATNAAKNKAEVAIAIRSDYKRRGVGWELLAHVALYAEAAGIETLESLESRDNHAAIELEREMGFTVATCDMDPTLVTVRRHLKVKQPERASALV